MNDAAMTAAIIAGIGSAGLAFGGFGATMGIGLYVVKRFPDRNDPDRARKRYTVPAGIGALLGVVGCFGMAAAAIGGVIVGLAPA